jgi:hypothetical protein
METIGLKYRVLHIVGICLVMEVVARRVRQLALDELVVQVVEEEHKLEHVQLRMEHKAEQYNVRVRMVL